MKIKNQILLSIILSILGLSSSMAAATFSINIQDGATEGFNDPTVVAPIGGNSGTTLGQQRLIVFQRAAAIWGNNINSSVTIVINSAFDPLPCNVNNGDILGGAGAVTFFSDANVFPVNDTWYPVALADSLLGININGSADINATFNSDVDNGASACSGSGWYYGLDGNTPGGFTPLLPVVLHELGHGLGFATITNGTTGAFTQSTPDIWTNFLYDVSTQSTWREMGSNAIRAASALNTFGLVWNGPNVNAKFPDILNPTTLRNQLTINSPGGIAGTHVAGGADFGLPVPNIGLTANVILIDDGVASPNVNDGCETINNDLTGVIALIIRGDCSFTVKVANAQAAGAIGVIIANNEDVGITGMTGVDPTITIPSIGISKTAGDAILSQLPGVNVTMDFSTTAFSGEVGGHASMYAPDPFQSGSSVSHWSTFATPNLLMEPSITSTIFSEIDLTYQLFQDIGWDMVEDLIYKDGFEAP